MRVPSRVGWVVLIAWLSSWTYFSRYSMLDDALIHLRYAEFLDKVHFITFDGVHPTYGTSSLLYVSILALLRTLVASPLLPKLVSTACYLLLVVVIVLLRRQSRPGSLERLLWFGLLLTTLTPMAARWLNDGMETGLVLLSVTLLAWWVNLEQDRETLSVLSYLTGILVGALLVLLRIELISLALLATGSVIAKRLQRRPPSPSATWQALHGTAMLVGALLAFGATRLLFGSFLPDTALAKSGFALEATLYSFVSAIGSSFGLGVGSGLLAILSGWFLLRQLSRQRAPLLGLLAWACANASFPLILILSCARGQIIQGIRHFAWTLYFATAWNALELNGLGNQEAPSRAHIRSATWAYAILMLGLLPFDWQSAARAIAGRANTFTTMRAANLGQFQGEQLVASDVGFIGYFTGANICDLNGLVNGRDIARLAFAERTHRCALSHPQLMFINDAQVFALSLSMNINTWVVCDRIDMPNVRGRDRHYLMFPGTSAMHACFNGHPPVPANQAIPALEQ